jgi:hypothetical protein
MLVDLPGTSVLGNDKDCVDTVQRQTHSLCLMPAVYCLV